MVPANTLYNPYKNIPKLVVEPITLPNPKASEEMIARHQRNRQIEESFNHWYVNDCLGGPNEYAKLFTLVSGDKIVTFVEYRKPGKDEILCSPVFEYRITSEGDDEYFTVVQTQKYIQGASND